MTFRRAVTGHDSDGKSIFASDEQVGTQGEMGLMALWASDEIMTFPDDGAFPPWAGQFPPIGGFRNEVPGSRIHRSIRAPRLWERSLPHKLCP